MRSRRLGGICHRTPTAWFVRGSGPRTIARRYCPVRDTRCLRSQGIIESAVLIGFDPIGRCDGPETVECCGEGSVGGAGCGQDAVLEDLRGDRPESVDDPAQHRVSATGAAASAEAVAVAAVAGGARGDLAGSGGGESLRSIARRLGRAPSTVSREVASHGGPAAIEPVSRIGARSGRCAARRRPSSPSARGCERWSRRSSSCAGHLNRSPVG